MNLITAPTKTDQLAQILRAEIREGKLEIGSRLSSVREMTKRFGVSNRIITLAIEQLQQENLVYSRPGKGVYVKNWQESEILELFLLLWNRYEREKISSFTNMLLAMTQPPNRPKGYRFSIRSIYDETLSDSHFERELNNILAMNSINCLLINSGELTPSTLPIVQNLKIPTIFLGDFSYDALDTSNLNQVAGNPFFEGYKSVEFMHEQGYKETLFFANDSIFYVSLFAQGARKAAEKYNIQVEQHEIPLSHGYKKGKILLDDVDILINKIGQKRVQTTPAIIYGPDEPVISAAKYRNPDSPPWVIPSYTGDFNQIFYDTVFSRIREVSTQKTEPKQIRPDIPILLTDRFTKRQWLFKENFKEL